MAAWRTKEQVSLPVTQRVGPQVVTVVASYPTRRRRDPDNVSGPAKAILDGLVDAGLLVDDGHTDIAEVRLRVDAGSPDVSKGRVKFTVVVEDAEGLE